MTMFQVGRVIDTIVNCYFNECTFLYFLIPCAYTCISYISAGCLDTVLFLNG